LLAVVRGLFWKVASATPPARRFSVQVGAVPLQDPLHPAKIAPGPGCAVSVTSVPAGRVMVQLAAQVVEVPSTEALMLPEPVLR